jgi:hypothetical protein
MDSASFVGRCGRRPWAEGEGRGGFGCGALSGDAVGAKDDEYAALVHPHPTLLPSRQLQPEERTFQVPVGPIAGPTHGLSQPQ